MKKITKTVLISIITVMVGFLLLVLLLVKYVEPDLATTSPEDARELGEKRAEELLDMVDNATNNKQQDASQDDSSQAILEESFNIYNETFLKLSKLQEEYEKEYAKFGKVSFEEAKAIPEQSEYPRYGSINREIISIRDNMPKVDFIDMSLEERNLLTDIKLYSMNLFFLNPQEDELEGIGVASDRRKIVEAALSEIKKTYE